MLILEWYEQNKLTSCYVVQFHMYSDKNQPFEYHSFGHLGWSMLKEVNYLCCLRMEILKIFLFFFFWGFFLLGGGGGLIKRL